MIDLLKHSQFSGRNFFDFVLLWASTDRIDCFFVCTDRTAKHNRNVTVRLEIRYDVIEVGKFPQFSFRTILSISLLHCFIRILSTFFVLNYKQMTIYFKQLMKFTWIFGCSHSNIQHYHEDGEWNNKIYSCWPWCIKWFTKNAQPFLTISTK